MYKRRIKIFLGLVAVVFAVMIARLGYLQILRGDDYRLQAEEALQKYELLPARRGRILDRTGEFVLAQDEACTDLCLHYRFLTADEKWILAQQKRIRKQEHVSLDEAGKIYQDRARRTWRVVEEQARERGVDLPATIEEIVRRVERIRAGRDYDVREQNQEHPVICALDNETAVRLKPQLEGTIGLALRSTHKRVHPFGDLACHVIGMTGRVWAEDLEERNLTAADEPDWLERLRRNYQPWDTIGRRGVEAMCENVLRGVRGSRRLKRIGSGVQVLEEVPAQHGHDVHLTLDLRLQQEGVAQLQKGGYTGCVVILSVPLGEVLALVSVPTFDLNRYSQDYEILAEETLYLPLLHRAVGRRYSPGSTIKPLMALAGLGTGAISEHTTFTCQGSFDPRYPDRFRCWNRSGHGSEDLRAALRDSCDVYFYHVGQLLGLDKAAPWLDRFGYGDLPGTGLPDERAGLVPTVDWMRRHGRTAELRGEARLEGIGQGVIEATPLHVANGIATIARGGKFLSPVLVLEGAPPRVSRDLGINPSHLRAVREGMFQVVNEPGATAYKAFFGDGVERLPFKVCGKTGTAQVAPQRIDSDGNGRITVQDRIARTGDMLWFIGYAPAEDPKVAFAVVLEYVQEGGGGRNAAPIAREMLRLCHRLGYLD